MTISTVADQRSLTGVAAAFSWQPLNGDGGVGTPVGAVTVDITRANGSALVTGAATVAPVAPATAYTYTLAAASCALMDVLTAVWKDGGVERQRTTLELVGGYYATIPQIRASDPTLADAGKFTDADIVRARTEVEHKFASVTSCDFAPRYHIERLDGNGGRMLILGWGPLRGVRAVTVYPSSSATGTVWTAAQLLQIPANESRIADCGTSNFWWSGGSNIVVEYESGYSTIPFDLRDQFLIEVRKQLNDTKSAIQLATPYDYDGGPQIDPVLAAQTRRLFSTLNQYSLRSPGIG